LRHARLVDLRAVTGALRTTVIPGLIGYVLAGQTMRWPLPQDFAITATFEVNVNGKDQSLAPTA
jgi:fimbrial chaperone protein